MLSPMRIPRIYYPEQLACGNTVTLDENASRHLLRVLRLAPGATVIVFNGRGGEYEARLDEIGNKLAAVTMERYIDCARESPLHITLAQGIARGERMDYTLQKAVELGVARIVPLFTDRCEVRLSGERIHRRVDHWRALMINACEQCGRTIIPDIVTPLPLTDWIGGLTSSQDFTTSPSAHARYKLVLDPRAAQSLSDLKAPHADKGILVLAGPEGGLSDAEITRAEQAGFIRLRLGPRILRTETAPLAVLAALQSLWGDLG